MADASVPLRNGKFEIVAQRLAMGDTQADAYRRAGYNSRDPASDASRLCRIHPEIQERANYLKDRMFDRQVDTKLVTKQEILLKLIETASAAADLEKPQLSVVHQCYRTIAEMEGHLVKKSEVKRFQGDPFEDASPEQLVDLIQRATTELGLNLDTGMLHGFIDSYPQAAGFQAKSDARKETGLLQAASEANRVPSSDDAPAPSDGGEPAGQV